MISLAFLRSDRLGDIERGWRRHSGDVTLGWAGARWRRYASRSHITVRPERSQARRADRRPEISEPFYTKPNKPFP